MHMKAVQCSILHITVSVILLISVIFPKTFYFVICSVAFVCSNCVSFVLTLLITVYLCLVCLMTFIYIIYGSIAFNL